MRYKNYTNEAIYELENQRIGDYNNVEDNETYCENGCFNSVIYNVDNRFLCQDCLIEEIRDTFNNILASEDDENNFTSEIIKDIISDFSDSEILTYIENRYDKI